jgi:hypothetical protein
VAEDIAKVEHAIELVERQIAGVEEEISQLRKD